MPKLNLKSTVKNKKQTDFSYENKELFSMFEYNDRMLTDAPEKLMKEPCGQ